jgi:hypothetical protein
LVSHKIKTYQKQFSSPCKHVWQTRGSGWQYNSNTGIMSTSALCGSTFFVFEKNYWSYAIKKKNVLGIWYLEGILTVHFKTYISWISSGI